MKKSNKSFNDYIWAILRYCMAWIFIWPFFDKLLGLGLTTAAENAWIAGGNPTYGFLAMGTKGPFVSLYQAIAGHPVVNWLFMIGLLLIGLALLFGISVKIASYSGVLMFFLMWAAVLPPEHNPFLDDHVIYSIILIGIAYMKAGFTWGLGEWWSKLKIVKNYPILQ